MYLLGGEWSPLDCNAALVVSFMLGNHTCSRFRSSKSVTFYHRLYTVMEHGDNAILDRNNFNAQRSCNLMQSVPSAAERWRHGDIARCQIHECDYASRHFLRKCINTHILPHNCNFW